MLSALKRGMGLKFRSDKHVFGGMRCEEVCEGIFYSHFWFGDIIRSTLVIGGRGWGDGRGQATHTLMMIDSVAIGEGFWV